MKSGRLALSVIVVLILAGAGAYALAATTIRPQLGLDLVGGVSVILRAPQGTEADVVDVAVETIRSRVDAFGVAEPDITRQGQESIQVQIPGVAEQVGAERQGDLLELIGQTARLEFREVLEVLPPAAEGYEEAEVPPETTPTEELEDQEVVFLDSEDETKYRLSEVLMTGDAISRAQASLGDVTTGAGGWQIEFSLTGEGARTFAEITRDRVGKQLAIILDRRVESAPNIEQEISGGQGQITGDFTEEEARNLALVLRYGALPVELTADQVQTVSPTLGQESLQQGLRAAVVGLLLLALYLAFYYRLLGVVTWFGMAIWATLSLSLVALLGRVAGYSLTLAGIAGLVVSLGITADSYIVFYERLKDEIRKGKTVRVAVVPAFQRAWKTIIAADLVTITAAVILYLVAVGGVRGFALTLGMATLLDMFVVYFFKRPTVYLIARSRFLSDLPGMGLRSGIAAMPEPQPVRGGSE
ncbi:MAG: protein translocase subunit SecD [Actinomycetota bacterium]|nr:protein translocase subunit SecD [Actinomycetota bacterium]